MGTEAVPPGWRENTLGVITVEQNDRVGSTSSPTVMSSTKHFGLVPSDEYFKNRTIYSSNLSNYRIVKTGWFAYATNHLTEGSIGLYRGASSACVSPIYTVFSCAEGVFPEYLFRLLKSPALMNQYRTHEQATVDRRGSIRYRDFKKISAVIPPFEEQCRIAAILDTLDDAIRRTEQVIAKLQKMKRGLLHDLLTRGVDEHGDLRDPVQNPEMFAETHLGLLPKHWELGGFSMFPCSDRELIKTGPFGTAMKGRRWADMGVPVITIGSLGERALIRENLLYLAPNDAASFSSYKLRPGDVVFSRVADVGRSLVIRDAEAGWIMSSNLMRISLDRARVVSAYVHLTIVYADSSRRQIRRLANAGAREVVNTAILTALKFAWPSREEQDHICAIVDAHDAQVAAELLVLDKFRLLKRGLMNDLLTGQARVPLPAEASA